MTTTAAYESAVTTVATSDLASAFSGSSVCVIGCTGLVGSAVCRVLASIAEEFDVRVVGVARRASPVLTESRHFRYVLANVANTSGSESVPVCDYYLYAAGAASDYLSRLETVLDTQCLGFHRILGCIGACKGAVFVSSTRVYGRNSGPQWLAEETAATVQQMRTDNIYDAAKYVAESLCALHYKKRAVPVSVARISNIYGPQRYRVSENAISNMIGQAVTRGRIALSGNPRSVRNYCSDLDVAQGLLRALAYGVRGEAYNIGSEEHLSSLELASTISGIMNVPVEIPECAENSELSTQFVDINKAKTTLGYRPKLRFSDVAGYVVDSTVAGMGEKGR